MEDILINIDSSYRNINLYPSESKFKIDLNNNYKNIVSLKILSFEINNSIINSLNYTSISSKKKNNWFTIYLPNKLNDPDGIKIYLSEGISNNIDNIITDINNTFNSIININMINNFTPNNTIYNSEKYIYFFYLKEKVIIKININFYINSINSNEFIELTINSGWFSLYGFILQIQNFITDYINNNINKIKTFNYFIVNDFTIQIYDIRYSLNKRSDIIRLGSINYYNINNFKIDFFKIYISNYPNLTINSTGIGILDQLLDTFNSIYYINSNTGSTINIVDKQLYNLNMILDSTKNTININNSINKWFLYNLTTFSTLITTNITEYDNITFEIDFNINTNLISVNNNIDINNINYPSLGYCLGFRTSQSNTSIFYSSIFNNLKTQINATSVVNLHNNNYAYLNINNWGYINFFNKILLTKIYFTNWRSNSKIDGYINYEYKFRQPINIQKLDIELLDFLGNIYDLNGLDFSFTIALTQVLNSNQKYTYETKDLIF